MTGTERLGASQVLAVAKVLTSEDGTYIVGGQALNLWAERYAAGVPELIAFGPFTSRDVDYYGHRQAALKLASALGGRATFPAPGDNGPNSAVVTAEVEGQVITIDFIDHVIGVSDAGLRQNALELAVPYQVNGERAVLYLPIMHPLDCLKSRISNVVILKRQTELALAQANAAPIVLREYMFADLQENGVRGVVRVMQRLFEWLRSDSVGRIAHTVVKYDPLQIITSVGNDPRLPDAYRQHNVPSMLRRITKARRA